jgi:hypothetical protein
MGQLANQALKERKERVELVEKITVFNLQCFLEKGAQPPAVHLDL